MAQMCVFTTAAQSDQKQIHSYNGSMFELFTPGPGKAGLKKTLADGEKAESHSQFVIVEL